MVAIHTDKPKVDLFKFFWKELQLVGARVYESEDFDQAIELLANKSLALDNYVTSVSGLDNIQNAFADLADNPQGMKALIACQD